MGIRLLIEFCLPAVTVCARISALVCAVISVDTKPHCLFTRKQPVFFVMAKWADYLISEAVYDASHLIFRAKRHPDTKEGIGAGTVVDRLTIASDIKNGQSYITIYGTPVSWKKGSKLQTFRIGGEPYIRIDNNKVRLDFLGDIPELQGYESELEQLSLESEQDPAPEPAETQPEPPPPSPRGSLPKDTDVELPQELELAPEGQDPAPEPAETQPEPPPPSPRGSLPKDTDVELPQELELAPEGQDPAPEPEEEATPEQLAQLDDLKSQIDELEDSLTNAKSSSGTAPEQKTEEPTDASDPEQLDVDDDASKPETRKSEDTLPQHKPRTKTRKRSKTAKSKKEAKAHDAEKETAPPLQKQGKKPDGMESKPQISKPGARTEPPSEKITAYCVKCKEKRPVADAQRTIMKNGRPAVRGACSVCGCKVFRIVKKQRLSKQ